MIVNVRKLHQTDSSSRITGGRGSLNTLIAPVVVKGAHNSPIVTGGTV
jgi:hypothetical protein